MSGDDLSRTSLVRLLGLMRDGKEVRQYLDRFGSVDRARFAVIKVGGAILRDQIDVLADALAFLHAVGLSPVVVHGAGPQLDDALAADGVDSTRIDGLRVTTPEVYRIARRVFTEENLRLAEAVRNAGARAAPIALGVFKAEIKDERLGLVGEPTAASIDLVSAAARVGAAPILASLAETPDGQIVNINADAAVRALVTELQPYKVVFLTGPGALLDEHGQVIPAINLATDEADLMAARWVNGGMRVKLEEISRLLSTLPLSASVSITRPDALAQELFTHTGDGTLVRRGERILDLKDKSVLDSERLEALVEDAFGRPVLPGWWEGLDLAAAHVTENYRAAALVSPVGSASEPVGYLDKFAVDAEARGEGLGQAVWRRLRAAWPQLVWRSRADNPINDFYFRQSDGSCRRGEWIVFWAGLENLAEIAGLIDMVVAKPITLEAMA